MAVTMSKSMCLRLRGSDVSTTTISTASYRQEQTRPRSYSIARPEPFIGQHQCRPLRLGLLNTPITTTPYNEQETPIVASTTATAATTIHDSVPRSQPERERLVADGSRSELRIIGTTHIVDRFVTEDERTSGFVYDRLRRECVPRVFPLANGRVFDRLTSATRKMTMFDDLRRRSLGEMAMLAEEERAENVQYEVVERPTFRAVVW